MNKNLITLSILTAMGAAVGVAQANTNVELYGTVNVAVQKKAGGNIVLQPQDYQYASKVGIKGKEDLGNGFTAIFKLEAQLNPDVGSGAYGSTGTAFGFDRESWVGLITPVGAARFGRSTTPFVNMWIGGGFGQGRGVGEFTGGLPGAGLRVDQPEVGRRWNNAFFYDVQKYGVTAGAAITTKGSQSVVPTGAYASSAPSLNTSINNEGAAGSKFAWGAYARYQGSVGDHGFKIGGAYQKDNGNTYTSVLTNTNAPAEGKDAYAFAAGYDYGRFGLSLGYAKSNIDNTALPLANTTPAIPYALRTGSSKTMFAAVNYKLTPNDKVYVSYGNYKRSNAYQFNTSIAGVGDIEGTQYSVGYEHALSKRTVVYANARKVGNITNSCSATLGGSALASTSPFYTATCGAAITRVNTVLDAEKDYSYDIGLSHSF